MKRAIIMYNLNTKEAFRFSSTRQAERMTGIGSGNMTPVLKEKDNKLTLKKVYTFFYADTWSYSNLIERIGLILAQHKTLKDFFAVNLTTNEKTRFSSMQQAERKLGFPHQAISRCLYGNQSSTHGYKFYWAKDIEIPEALPQVKEMKEVAKKENTK